MKWNKFQAPIILSYVLEFKLNKGKDCVLFLLFHPQHLAYYHSQSR